MHGWLTDVFGSIWWFLKGLKLAVRDIYASHLPSGYLGFNGGAELGQRLNGYGTGSVLARSEPFYELQAQPQVEKQEI